MCEPVPRRYRMKIVESPSGECQSVEGELHPKGRWVRFEELVDYLAKNKQCKCVVPEVPVGFTKMEPSKVRCDACGELIQPVICENCKTINSSHNAMYGEQFMEINRLLAQYAKCNERDVVGAIISNRIDVAFNEKACVSIDKWDELTNDLILWKNVQKVSYNREEIREIVNHLLTLQSRLVGHTESAEVEEVFRGINEVVAKINSLK